MSGKVWQKRSAKRSWSLDPALAQDLGTTGSMSSSSLSRRALLVRMTASTAAAAMGVGVPRLFAKQETESPSIDRIAGEAQASRAVAGGARRAQAFRIRLKAALRELKVPLPLQISNGDETLYPNRIGSYSKGLPHDSIGEVDPPAYSSLLTAVGSMDPNDFANIPLGGNVKLADPQGGLAFDLEGTDSGQLTIPPSPALASAERAGEMVEDYWMALTRDVPFSQYGSEAVTAAAIADLNKLADFKGPRENGRVTAATLFRGFTTADLVGPFLSQFLLLPVSFGTLSVLQQYKTYASGTDYLTDFASCLACQNGQDPFPPNVVSGTSYTKSGRDLGAYVHADLPYQAYLTAAQWLLADKVPLNPGNPYLHISNQSGFQTFGGPHILDLLGEVTNRALKAVWYQKWFVHRTARTALPTARTTGRTPNSSTPLARSWTDAPPSPWSTLISGRESSKAVAWPPKCAGCEGSIPTTSSSTSIPSLPASESSHPEAKTKATTYSGLA